VIAQIPDALAALSADHRLAVATSKPPRVRRAAADLARPALPLRAIAAPGLHAHPEDKTATIRGALSALRTAHAEMVGDRLFDIIGAHACAIPAIGVTWGIGSR
jgi:phosphoglycolate phosphatase